MASPGTRPSSQDGRSGVAGDLVDMDRPGQYPPATVPASRPAGRHRWRKSGPGNQTQDFLFTVGVDRLRIRRCLFASNH